MVDLVKIVKKRNFELKNQSICNSVGRVILILLFGAISNAEALSRPTVSNLSGNQSIHVGESYRLVGTVSADPTDLLTTVTAAVVGPGIPESNTTAMRRDNVYGSIFSLSNFTFDTSTFSQTGTYTIGIWAKTIGFPEPNAEIRTFTITVSEPSNPPTLTGLSSNQSIAAGATYRLQGTVSAPTGKRLKTVTAAVTGTGISESNNSHMRRDNLSVTSFNLSTFTFNSATFDQPGNYTVGIWVALDDGRASQFLNSFTITVAVPPAGPPTVTGLSSDQSIEAGATYTLQGTVSAPAGKKLMTVTAAVTGTGIPVSDNNHMRRENLDANSFNLSTFTFDSAAFAQPGNYTIGIWVVLDDGSDAQPLDDFHIAVRAPPTHATVAGLSSDQSISAGATYTLQGTVSAPSGKKLRTITAAVTGTDIPVSDNFHMRRDEANISSFDLSNFTFNSAAFAQPGNYTVGIWAALNDGSSAQFLKSFDITVAAPAGLPRVSGLPSDQMIAAGASFALQGTVIAPSGKLLKTVTAAITGTEIPVSDNDHMRRDNVGSSSFDLSAFTFNSAEFAQPGLYTIGIWVALNDGSPPVRLQKFDITVAASPGAPTLSGLSSDQSIAAGTSFTLLGTVTAPVDRKLKTITAAVTGTGIPVSDVNHMRRDNVNVSSFDLSNFTFNSAAFAQPGNYTIGIWVALDDGGDAQFLKSFNILVGELPGIRILRTPVARTTGVGGTAEFRVEAEGDGNLSYQWYRNGTPITGATGSQYRISPVATTDAGQFHVVVSSGGQSVTTTPVWLAVATAPAITSQPNDIVVGSSGSATFAVSATGLGSLNYQWFKDGFQVEGATGRTFTITSVTTDDAADYSVDVSNSIGTTRSANATLTIGSPSTELSIVSARQLDGSKSVKVEFALTGTILSPLQIEFTVSSDGGKSFSINPSGEELSGDTTVSAPGTYSVVWNATGMAAGNNYVAKLVATGTGQSSTGQSAVFAVNTATTRSLSLIGRLLDDVTKQPLSGITLRINTASASTDANGNFRFANLSAGDAVTLTADVSGYLSLQRQVDLNASLVEQQIGDVFLRPVPNTSKPIVIDLSSAQDGLFLSNIEYPNLYSAQVDWNGAVPGRIEYLINGMAFSDLVWTGPESGSVTIDMGNDLTPSFREPNLVSVVAVAGSGVRSDPRELPVRVLPLPEQLRFVAAKSIHVIPSRGQIGIDFNLTKTPINFSKHLPLIEDIGFRFDLPMSFDYTIPNGEWEFVAGIGKEFYKGKRGRRPNFPGIKKNLELWIGNRRAEGDLSIFMNGLATVQNGIEFRSAGYKGNLDFAGELNQYSLGKAVPPLATAVENNLLLRPFRTELRRVVKKTKLILWVHFGVGLRGELDLRNGLNVRSFGGNLRLGGSMSLDVPLAKKLLISGYIGGEFDADFLYDVPANQFLGSLAFALPYRTKIVATAFGKEFDVQFNGVVGPYQLLGERLPSGLNQHIGSDWRAVDRGYLESGSEVFLLEQSSFVANGITLSNLDTQALTPLERFRVLSSQPETPSSHQRKAQSTRTPSAIQNVDQADLTLLQNTYSYSAPVLAAHGTNLMILYVADNGSTNEHHFTDIRWTRWDGVNWSVPSTIAPDDRAEFSLTIAFDGLGNAVAVWHRVSDVTVQTNDLKEIGRHTEIVWSHFNATQGTWSIPVQLTTNSVLDHSPLLAGPFRNGELMLLWTRNENNELVPSDDSELSADTLMSSIWSPATGTWSSPSTVLRSSGLLSFDFDVDGDTALLSFVEDADGDTEDSSDQHVFYLTGSVTNWSGNAVQLSTNELGGNRRVAVEFSSSGIPHVFWLDDVGLVLSKNLSRSLSLVKGAEESIRLNNYQAVAGPGGNMGVLWQQMGPDGSDIYYSVLDPESGTWSADNRLFKSLAVERAMAPVWDNLGNLTLTYNAVDVVLTNRDVVAENGSALTITNAPTLGRTDLAVTKRALIKDLVVGTNDFVVSGSNFLPGDHLTMNMTVRNRGDVALTNVTAAVYNGPILVTNVSVEGWLEGHGTRTFSVDWTMPANAGASLFMIVDPNQQIAEFEEANNIAVFPLIRHDAGLVVGLPKIQDGNRFRATARVSNIGNQFISDAVLVVTNASNAVPIRSYSIPSLIPGSSADIVIESANDSLISGPNHFVASVTLATGTIEMNPSNNVVPISVLHVIDSDMDGLPDDWETRFAQAATDVQPDLDTDGDGLSNMNEFLAGTDPTDGGSFLRLEQSRMGRTETGNRIVWGARSGRLYSILRATNVKGPYSVVAQHVTATGAENILVDTSAADGVVYFYRLALAHHHSVA